MTATKNALGLPWQVEIPDEWPAVRVKYVSKVQLSNVDKKSVPGEEPVRLCNYIDVYRNDVITDDLEFMAATATAAQVANFALIKGDVLVTKDSEAWDDIAVPAVVAEDLDGVLCGYHLALIRPDPLRAYGPYLARCFRATGLAEQFAISANGVTRFGLGKDEIAGARFPLPPRATQRRIADYLDREAAAIDALIAAKERLLAILAEKRRALITRAVTRGLNPKVALRESGCSWLGEIPRHWQAKRLKFLGDVRTGLTIGKNYGTRPLSEYFYLRVANVQDSHLVLDDLTTVAVPDSEADSCLLKSGDVLMNEGGDIDKLGRGCVWRGEISPCLHQNHVFSVRPHGVDSDWLAAWTATLPAKSYFESHAKRTTNLASISSANIKELPVPLPPDAEQKAILAYAQKASAALDALWTSAQRTVILLKERRAALIAAAVTGQIVVKD